MIMMVSNRLLLALDCAIFNEGGMKHACTKKKGRSAMKLWARVGMTIEVPEDEVLDFAQNMENRIEQYYERGLAKFDGEVYLPEDVDCEENDAMLKIMSDEWEKKNEIFKAIMRGK